jgi:exosortase D (VPLPA-CTERM-specific)
VAENLGAELTIMGSQKKSLPILPSVFAAALVLSIIWSYWPVLENLIRYIIKDDDYSFGLLIPFIVGYIVYLKWPEVQKNIWQPSWLGLLIIIFGYLLYISGETLTSFYISGFSLVIVISGFLFLLGGWKLFRLMGFPLILLFLMIPSDTWFIRRISLQLQLLSSQLAAGMLAWLGIPVLRQGNILDLGVRQLQVVAACSGLRYILSLLTLAVIFCYFYQRRLWKAAVLTAAMIPAAILANALRVTAMALYPSLQAEGFWHNFTGWLIFVGCFGVLVLLNWVLNRFWPDLRPPGASRTEPQSDLSLEVSRRSVTPCLIATLILVILLSPVPKRLAQVPTVPLLRSFNQFPLKIGPWRGQRGYVDDETIKVLGTSDYFEATFIGPENKPVTLWIAYYGNLKKRVGLAHSPLVCMTGGGWTLKQSREVEMLPGKPVNYMLMQEGDQRLVVYYWFIQRGRWLPNEYFNKLYLGLDSLLKRRADGALIRITTPVNADVESARKRLNDYAQVLVPILPKFLPD